MTKFSHKLFTEKGESRAFVDLKEITTLWFNTGTVCNLSCSNCYFKSSPDNDSLSFITKEDVLSYCDSSYIHKDKTLLGFTGGEPTVNPSFIAIVKAVLERGFKILVLTNAYSIRKTVFDSIEKLNLEYPGKLTFRISLDSYLEDEHDDMRGEGRFAKTMCNIKELLSRNIYLTVAGRNPSSNNLKVVTSRYLELMKQLKIGDESDLSSRLSVFPEMDYQEDCPEITTKCWGILNKSPDDMMCSSSRMVVKRKGESKTEVISCTLLPYDKEFSLGSSLENSVKRVYLKNKFCAQFCVLGGASCSG